MEVAPRRCANDAAPIDIAHAFGARTPFARRTFERYHRRVP